MNKSIKAILLLALLLFTSCNIFSGGTPSINMTNFDSTFAVGETVPIAINVEGMNKKIFGMSLRIVYDPDFVSFDDTQNDWIGSMWSTGTIGILEDVNNTIYISISEIAGGVDFKPNGTIITLNFTLEQSGTTLIDFVDDQIFFYDEDGTVINLSEIEVEGYSLTIE
ncbi:MAG: cohesin domain-containing protein [Candidatus Marinimicrobia bacterium]|nr:cohesin domain-containing protein [Candidatus Neomarinimicrobiota bacterium]